MSFRMILAVLVVGATIPAFAQEGEGEAVGKDLRRLGVVLFPGFELLDAAGPMEMFGNVGKELEVIAVAEKAGPVKSYQGVKMVADYGFEDCPELDILLVPGGFGALHLMSNETFMDWLRERSEKAELTISVCNGSQLLAGAGILDGRRATTNKMYYNQIISIGPNVQWVKEARWVDDGDIVTSSGVSAGMDMALHIISRLYGEAKAEEIARATEYQWHRDADVDPFANLAE
jgi:transcriptional regulator GlxA family with amidase domain